MHLSHGRTKLILSVPMKLWNEIYFKSLETGISMSRLVLDTIRDKFMPRYYRADNDNKEGA